MSADPNAVADEQVSFAPARLSRRSALMGVAALFTPLPANLLAAVPSASAARSGPMLLNGNENPYGPSPAARQAILANVGDRARVHAALDRMGLRRADSQGNFVFFDTGAPLQKFQERMPAQGIKVGRRFDGYDTWARVTIGLHHEVGRFLTALPGALGA